MRILKVSSVLAFVFGCTQIVFAEDNVTDPAKFGWVVKADLEYGGDQIARVYYTNNTEQSVKAGQGVGLGLGGHYQPAGSKFDFSGTVGFKYVGTQASNANINLTRAIMELRADYLINDNIWVGAGPVYHTNIKLNSDGVGPDLSFDPALGFTAKIGWKFVALSYTGMTYKDKYGIQYSANNLGVSFIGKF